MKILLISPVPPPQGGIATWTNNFCLRFENNNEITIINTSRQNKICRNIISRALRQLKRNYRIIRKLKSNLVNNYDIAHINSSCSAIGIFRDYCCSKELKKHNIPFVFHCHCNIEDQLGKNWLSRHFFSKIVKIASKVYVLNESSRLYCERIIANKVMKIPNSIDEGFIAEKHTISKKIMTIIFVGHLYKTKGIDSIILTSKKYPNINFRVIGPYTKDYDNSCNTSNLFFLGKKNKTEIVEELDKADVFLFPTHTEGFSIALLEAMARGIPIITTDVGANKEMLESKGGIVLKIIPNGPIDLSEVLEAKIRSRMSFWSIKRVREHYTHENVFKIIEEDYQTIISSNRNL